MQVKDVRISLVEMTDHVLSMYDREISRYTAGGRQGSGEESYLGGIQLPRPASGVPAGAEAGLLAQSRSIAGLPSV